MNQLSTDIKTHVIITFTKAHHMITQKQYDAVIQMGSQGQVIIDGNMVKTSNIADILTMEKYRETHPEKISHENFGGQPFSKDVMYDWDEIGDIDLEAGGFQGLINKAGRNKARLEAMLRGIRKWLNSSACKESYYKGANSREFEKKILLKLKELENTEHTTNIA